MSKILGVGIATLDIINTVDHYPQEDEELRALGQRILRGGNVTNTLVTLAQMGHQCSWAGTLSDEPNAAIIHEELKHYHIDAQWVVEHHHARLPTSYITLNQLTGSRTIVHYRELEEYDFEAFARIPLERFDWLHFEGRNIEQLELMLKHVHALYPELKVSLEVEKPRPGIEALFPYAHVLLFSRAYAQHQGHNSGRECLDAQNNQTQQMFCAWGSQGAYARQGNEEYFTPAITPGEVVDTIGAGDVFNAGVIHALAAGWTLAQALQQAVTLAGEHCCRTGFRLKD